MGEFSLGNSGRTLIRERGVVHKAILTAIYQEIFDVFKQRSARLFDYKLLIDRADFIILIAYFF